MEFVKNQLQSNPEEKLECKERRFGFAFSRFRDNFIFGLVLTAIIVLVLMAFLCPKCWSDASYAWRHITISGMYGMGLYLAMSYLNGYINGRVSWLEKPWTSFFIVFALNTLTVIVVVIIVNLIWRGLFFGQGPIEAFNAISTSQYLIPIIIGLFITSIFIGASFLDTWKKSLLQTEQFKQAQLTAKFEALNSQVNPHFLFNSLNVLSNLVKKDPDRAEDFIQQLSNVYRNVLDFRKEELISLKKELETLNAYKFLIETRFGERIVLENSLVPEEDQFVVPLSLQMLLENAIKHNAATSKNPLKISIFKKENKIWVVNNRQKLNEEIDGRKMGLENIAERYRLATDSEIIVEESEDFFKVGLPIISN